MTGEPIEADGISLVAHHDLDNRPGFKMALHEDGGQLYLYLGHFWHSGWTIVDVTDAHEPELVTFVEGPDNTVTKNLQVAEGLMITGLERPGTKYGHVTDPMRPDRPWSEGAYIFDVETDPTDPALLAHHETGGTGTHRNFYDGGRYAYLMAWPAAFDGGMLSVLDLDDPTDPVEVAQWWWPGQHENDDEPSAFPRYGHGPAYVRGDRAYLSYGRVGGLILDVADPTAPDLRSRLGMADGMGSWLGTHSFVPLPDSDIAAMTTEAIREDSPLEDGEGLNYAALVDISDDRMPAFGDEREPIGPKVLSILPHPTPGPEVPYDNYHEKSGRFGPHNLHHAREEPLRYRTDDYLILAYFNAGLRIYEISDPLAPVEAAHYVPEDPDERIGTRPASGLVSHFEDVVVDHRGYIFVTDTNNGLFVLEADCL